MNEWISVRHKLTEDNSFVEIKMCMLFKKRKRDCLYVNKYFTLKGENITRWVTHWKPSQESDK